MPVSDEEHLLVAAALVACQQSILAGWLCLHKLAGCMVTQQAWGLRKPVLTKPKEIKSLAQLGLSYGFVA